MTMKRSSFVNQHSYKMTLNKIQVFLILIILPLIISHCKVVLFFDENDCEKFLLPEVIARTTSKLTIITFHHKEPPSNRRKTKKQKSTVPSDTIIDALTRHTTILPEPSSSNVEQAAETAIISPPQRYLIDNETFKSELAILFLILKAHFSFMACLHCTSQYLIPSQTPTSYQIPTLQLAISIISPLRSIVKYIYKTLFTYLHVLFNPEIIFTPLLPSPLILLWPSPAPRLQFLNSKFTFVYGKFTLIHEFVLFFSRDALEKQWL